MRKSLKFIVPVLFLLVALIGINAYTGSRPQTRAEELLASVEMDSGIKLSDLEVTAIEAQEMGLTAEQAQDACTVYKVMAQNGVFTADEFTVGYLTDGGSPVPDTVKVPAGSKLVKPADPVKAGYTFKHWEYRQACDSKTYIWNFDSDIVGFNMILVAVYDKNSTDTYYNVNFDTAGGLPVPNAQRVKAGDKVSKPVEPFKAGSDFIGWYNGDKEWNFDSDTVSGNMLLVAKYKATAKEFTVTFDANGGTPVPDPQKIKEGEKATKPADPTLDGFKFIGWFIKDTDTLFDFDTPISSETFLVAKWEDENISKTFTVTFDANGGTPAPAAQTVKYKEKATKPADPALAGHVFVAWFLKGTETQYDFNSEVTKNLELVAKFQDENDGKLFTVTFDAKGGTPAPATQTVKYKEKATKPADPTLAGHIFVNWLIKGTETVYDFNTPVTKNIELEAKYKDENDGKTFTVTFDAKGGTPAPAAQTVKYNEKATKPATDPVLANHIFVNWLIKGTETVFDFSTPITKNMELVAKYKDENDGKTFTVTFDAKGGTPAPAAQTVAYKKTATKPADPTLAGHIFVNWLIKGTETVYNFSTPVTKNIDLEAKYKDENDGKTFTVTFDAKGGTPAPAAQTVVYKEKATKPANPTLAGHIFVNWLIKGTETVYDFNTPVTKNIDLEAKYKDENDGKTFTVTFDAKGGTPAPAAQTVVYKEKATKPANPTLAGHTFVNWFIKGTETIYDFNTPVTKNVELEAKYKDENDGKIFTVTFDADGGSPVPAVQNVKYKEKAAKPADPAKNGYKFAGWATADGKVWNFDTDLVLGNTVLKAKWEDDINNKMFDVTFNADGGTPVPAKQVVKYGNKVTEPTAPSKADNKFEGWTFNGKIWNFDTDVVKSDMVLVAKYSKIEKFTVTFNANGGAPTPASQSVVKGDKVVEPLVIPTKAGYIFEGWTYNNVEWNFATGVVNSNMELIASYKVDPTQQEYLVTFNANGGNPTPAGQKVKYGNLATKPAVDPAKTGFNFAYWYTEDANGREKEWNFNSDRVNGNITLYAKYTEKEKYKITFETFGGTPVPAPQYVTRDELVTKPADPVKPGYKFLYWYSAGHENTAIDFRTTYFVGESTLYAKYEDERVGKTFCVSFFTDGGEPKPADQNIKFGEKVSKPTDPKKDGFIFTGWVYFDENLKETPWNFDVDTVKGNTQLIARYTVKPANYYNVYFNADGGTPVPASQRVKEGDKVTKPADPTKPGYDFIGWYNGDKLWNFDTDKVTAETTLIAKYKVKTPEKFVVVFDSYGGAPVPPNQIVEAGQKVTKPADPKKDGFVLASWFYLDANGRAVTWNFDKDVVTGNLILVAKYDVKPAEKVTVKFDTNGGTPVPADQIVLAGSKIVQPISPIKSGYNFTGWYAYANGKETKWNFATDIVNANMTLYAKYDVAACMTVKFDADGGKPVPATQSVKYNGFAVKPSAPTKAGFEFMGWYYKDPATGNEKLWDFGADRVMKDMTLVAKWKASEKTIKITWYDCMRCTYTYTYIKAGETIQKIADPNGNACYRFFRWTYNCAEWDFSKPVYNDMKLSAQYVSNCYYIVKYNTAGGSFVPMDYVCKNATYKPTAKTTMTGRTFAGWTLNGTGSVVTSVKATSDLNFVASWK